MTRAMDPSGGSVYPRSAEEAHDHMSKLLDEALAGGRSALLVTMKPMPDQTIDVKLGMMNLDQHAKGLLMVAFAVAYMNQKSGSCIKDDLVTLGSFVGNLIE